MQGGLTTCWFPGDHPAIIDGSIKPDKLCASSHGAASPHTGYQTEARPTRGGRGKAHATSSPEPDDNDLANDYWELYAAQSRSLRGWLIAYGIGAVFLFTSQAAFSQTCLRTGDGRQRPS